MSTNGFNATRETDNSVASGSGIRLPPISFLSRDNHHQPLTSMQPIAQRPLNKLELPFQSIRTNIIEQSDNFTEEKGKQLLDRPLVPSHRGLDIYSVMQLEKKTPYADAVSSQHSIASVGASAQQQQQQQHSQPEQHRAEATIQKESPPGNSHIPSLSNGHVASSGDDHEPNFSNGGGERHLSENQQHPFRDEAASSINGTVHPTGVPQGVKVPKNRAPKIDRTSFEKAIEELFPNKRHLGTIVYNPTTTWSTLQIDQMHGLKPEDKSRLLEIKQEYEHRVSQTYTKEEHMYIPVIPPLPESYVNSFVEVKIPYKYVKEHIILSMSGKVQRRRELWGGLSDIYTDDSDILSVLTHLGLFNNSLDLSATNPSWAHKDVIRPLKVYHDEDGFELLDLSVTILLLPPLLRYHGFYRNGINSRSWLGDSSHDGLSYGVFNLKWETLLTFIDERNLYKWSLKEDAIDRDYEKKLLESGSGWNFDRNHYKELKERYLKLDSQETLRHSD